MLQNGDIQLSPLLWYTVPMVLEHMSLKENVMAVQPDMIGIVVRDMAAALKFYRMLGLAIPEGVEGEAHVEVTTPNGYRIAWDAFWGQRYAVVADPDGTLIDLFAGL